ncbi:Triosephosphate isomerase [Limosilactobacillus gastricus PS3]|uniref:Triosephosphate isomerase n=1 Tax=Limosilactobacillus gastricus PS3 TaxID=1144300 RepID=H4GKM8_9LACO|nr:triose-phosphate isomerase [Limosilactobacillus gastricus]EHS85197.1 Triosephosphate isomerase [Limosilactobacillus gastricus PS3]
MRTPIVAGNWKMNKTVAESVEFVRQIKTALPPATQLETALAGQPIALTAMLEAAQDSPLKIAAENCYYQSSGPYTGETSPTALYAAGIHHVILGHSERRQLFHEDDQLINRKIKAAITAGICPIVCCDETMGRLITSQRVEWVVARILDDLKGLTAQQAEQVTIAYEPTWAIGSGESADPSQAEEGCYLIRQTLGHMFNETVAQQTRILYGGSITPDNIKQMMAKPDIDGVLVGGASLDPRTFLKLVNFND